jgi:hypothetical protein
MRVSLAADVAWLIFPALMLNKIRPSRTSATVRLPDEIFGGG